MIRKWNDILSHYEPFAEKSEALAGIRDLVAYIAKGPLSNALYGWTSVVDLCIVQTEVSYPYSGPLLRISPMGNGNVEFRYEDTQQKARQWHREVAPSEAVARLNNFLGQLGWVSGVLASNHSLQGRRP